MTKTIIASYDGSKHAEKAVHAAAELAKALGGEIILLNIQPNLNVGNVRRFFSEKEILMYEQESGMKVLEKPQQFLESEGIPFRSIVRHGEPSKEICSIAEETDASYIVMGTRGMGAIAGTLLGSVSTGVLHHAKCPVLIIPSVE